MANTHCGKHDKIVPDGMTCPGCDTEAAQVAAAEKPKGKKEKEDKE
jgi:hypothetical protein